MTKGNLSSDKWKPFSVEDEHSQCISWLLPSLTKSCQTRRTARQTTYSVMPKWTFNHYTSFQTEDCSPAQLYQRWDLCVINRMSTSSFFFFPINDCCGWISTFFFFVFALEASGKHEFCSSPPKNNRAISIACFKENICLVTKDKQLW